MGDAIGNPYSEAKPSIQLCLPTTVLGTFKTYALIYDFPILQRILLARVPSTSDRPHPYAGVSPRETSRCVRAKNGGRSIPDDPFLKRLHPGWRESSAASIMQSVLRVVFRFT